MAVHVRYKSLNISLPSSAKQQRDMTNSALSVELELRRIIKKKKKILFQIYCGVLNSISR